MRETYRVGSYYYLVYSLIFFLAHFFGIGAVSPLIPAIGCLGVFVILLAMSVEDEKRERWMKLWRKDL